MPLDKAFIETQKLALVEEKKRLLEKIKKLKVYPDYGDIGEDTIQEVVDYENNISIEEQLQFLVDKIDKALKSIENDTYGKCSKCGASIEEGRLLVMPYADVCVSCEKKIK